MAQDDKKANRRLIKPTTSEVSVLPSLQTMLDDALSVINVEIIRFKYKVQTNPSENKGLTPNEARMLQGYIKSLVDLSKEARERSDDMDLANMTDQELIDMVETLKKKKEQQRD